MKGNGKTERTGEDRDEEKMSERGDRAGGGAGRHRRSLFQNLFQIFIFGSAALENLVPRFSHMIANQREG